MIEVLNLTKTLNNSKVVDSLSFTVEKGEIVGLVGPNGSGKSLICDMITGYTSYVGSVKISSYDMEAFSRLAKEKLGYFPEVGAAYPDMSVSEFLKFVTKLKKADNYLDLVNSFAIHDVMATRICHLTKFQYSKVCMVAALIGNPEVLILDDPAKGVDNKEEIYNYIRAVSTDRAVLVCSVEEHPIFDRTVTLNNESLILELDELDELIMTEEMEENLEEENLSDVTEVFEVYEEDSVEDDTKEDTAKEINNEEDNN